MMRRMKYRFGDVQITRLYGPDDPIFRLPDEKQDRQLVADVQRDLQVEADRLAATPVTVRG